ncbi:hypothetical protein Taro_031756 [Colocasia esculenta]|uniref:Uncharacterized protein n=1 Tax=Colocasia esculenta TaxID=4460 RepID=A0A843W422_COLES|nr:hypothetical protein [Colocasia esculenta]
MALEMSLMEGGIARLQSPAGLGFGVGGGPRELGSLWRWSAILLLAALAAYGSLIARARLLLRRLHSHLCRPALQQPQQQQQYFDDDDDDTCSSCCSDDTCSSCSEEDLLSAEEMEAAEEDEEAEVAVRQGYFGDFAESEGRDAGFDLRGGREVVKAWGGSDLRFDDSSALGCVFSLCDLHTDEIVRSFMAGDGRTAAAAACVASTQPAVVLSAGDAAAGRRLELRLWDARVGDRTPAAFANFSPRLRKRVQRLGGEGKVVYVGDGAGSAAAVDLRKVRPLVGRVAEEEATWWDADAVVVSGADVAGFLQEEAPWTATTRRLRHRRN